MFRWLLFTFGFCGTASIFNVLPEGTSVANNDINNIRKRYEEFRQDYENPKEYDYFDEKGFEIHFESLPKEYYLKSKALWTPEIESLRLNWLSYEEKALEIDRQIRLEIDEIQYQMYRKFGTILPYDVKKLPSWKRFVKIKIDYEMIKKKFKNEYDTRLVFVKQNLDFYLPIFKILKVTKDNNKSVEFNYDCGDFLEQFMKDFNTMYSDDLVLKYKEINIDSAIFYCVES